LQGRWEESSQRWFISVSPAFIFTEWMNEWMHDSFFFSPCPIRLSCF
jgi:hypothetical protein